MNNRFNNIDCNTDTLTFDKCIELIEYYLQEYKELHDIESYKDLTQMQFHAALMYVFQHAFCRKEPVKYNFKSIINYSDTELLYNLCMYYIYYMALPNNKVISIYQYSTLIGLSKDIISSWKDEKNDIYKIAIYKTLYEIREQNIADKLLSDDYKSPVALIAVLNRQYNWNQYGNVIVNQNQISSADLNSISSRYNSAALENNNDQLQNMATLPDTEFQDDN